MKTALKKLFHRFGYDIRRIVPNQRVWIDVGAHRGQHSFPVAQSDSSVLVFAFEPNWKLARELMGKLANFVVLPMAASDKDGIADFFIHALDPASSLLPVNPAGLKYWPDFEYKLEATVSVPTIRLDTFMHLAGLQTVDYLKVDTQGGDFKVLQSAGERLKDIRKIMVEVSLTPDLPWQGAATREEFVAFMETRNFALTRGEVVNQGREENLTFEHRHRGVQV